MTRTSWTRGADLALLGLGGLVAWQLVLYPLALTVMSRLRSRRPPPSGPYTPSLTVLLPTYNEAAVIQQRLVNLAESEYPAELLQVIVIDSASTDGTCEQVEAYRRDGRLRDLELVRESERRGKCAALNLGLVRAQGDIVVITDAPALFARDALARIVRNFADPAVGAASGVFRVPEQHSLAQQEEALFWELRDRLRLLEARVDSTPFLSGEFCCFRRGLVQPFPEDTMADDMNVAMQVRQAGYRAIVEPEALFWEPRSARFAELTVTKTRRAICGLQALLRSRHMWFRPRYGLFGMLILPSAFLYYLPLRTFFFLLAGSRLLGWLRRRRLGLLAAGGLLTALGTPAAGEHRRGLVRWLTLAAFNEWVFLRAFVMLVLNRYSVRWEQESSTRTPLSAPEQNVLLRPQEARHS